MKLSPPSQMTSLGSFYFKVLPKNKFEASTIFPQLFLRNFYNSKRSTTLWNWKEKWNSLFPQCDLLYFQKIRSTVRLQKEWILRKKFWAVLSHLLPNAKELRCSFSSISEWCDKFFWTMLGFLNFYNCNKSNRRLSWTKGQKRQPSRSIWKGTLYILVHLKK